MHAIENTRVYNLYGEQGVNAETVIVLETSRYTFLVNVC